MDRNSLREKFAWQEYLEALFKISYVLLAFSTYVTVLYISPVQSYLVKICLVLGAVVILTRLLKWKDYIKTPGLILMALMCASFLLSSFMNRQYGLTDNLKWLIWMGIQFFALYAIPLKREKSHVILEYKIISSLVLIGSVLASIASLKMLPEGYSEIIETADGEAIITGFTWDRLWGVYTDPNYGAVVSVIAIFIALGWIFISKRIAVKILSGLAMAVDYTYIIFADSRTGLLALSIGLVFFLGIVFFEKIKKEKTGPGEERHTGRIFLGALVAVLLIVVCYGGGYVWKENNIQYQEQVAKEAAQEAAKEAAKKAAQTTAQNTNKTPASSSQKKENANTKIVTEREKQLTEDASNGRLSLWKSAIEVWETSPIYGTGYSTFSKYAEEHAPNTYAVNNDLGVYTSLHNEFFNVLAYQGGLGAILFVLIILRLVIYILKRIFSPIRQGDLYPLPILCCLGTVAVSMAFLLDGLYTNSVSAAVLWIFSGYLVNLAGCKEEEKSQKEA